MSVVLSEHLPLLATAPNGIQKLRELILELAVRGKLVPQDPDDEPASELLKRIAKERTQLEAEGTCKKAKPLSPAGEDEPPFAIPAVWKWTRLGKLGVIGSSSRIHQKDWTDQGVPFYRAREIVKLSQVGFVLNELYISEDHYKSLTASGLVPSADDLMVTGVGTIGVPYIVKAADRFYFKDASVLIFKNYHRLCAEYIRLFMKSPYWVEQIHEASMGTTVHTLTIIRANEVPVPLPPLAEQHRIVAKVDELMALCDRLEAEVGAGDTAHAKLVEALLGTLTQSTDADDLAANWQRLAEHFVTLFTTESSLDALKQTILQLAVMGKLVPQDPDDEPASELLKRIAKERTQLEAEGTCKKSKATPLVGEDEQPFALPKSWEWVRVASFGETQTGTTPSKSQPNLFGKDIPFIKPGDISDQGIYYENEGLSSEGVANSGRLAHSGSVLMVCIGTIGKCGVIDRSCSFNQQINSITPVAGTSPFVFIAMRSHYFQSEAWSRSSSTTIAILNKGNWEVIPLPLPPLAEQHRIVAKVDELMALCDRLKADLAESRTRQARLSATLIESALQAA